MNIGIVVYSGTGFTKKFASLINDELKAKGHTVHIAYLETDVPMEKGGRTAEFKIMNMPDCSKDDLIIAGGPVWGGMPNSVTMSCINEIKGIENKQFIPFVTMMFPFKFMGGYNAISRMNSAAKSRGALPERGAIVTRAWHDFDEMLKKETEKIIETLLKK